MQQGDVAGARPRLKQIAAEAHQALARLDAARLEELALSCSILAPALLKPAPESRVALRIEAQDALNDLAILGRLLEATRSNLKVMNRLRELREVSIEYSEMQARGWPEMEGHYGND